MSTFLKQKFVVAAIVMVTAVLMIFGLAMMGSVLGAKPKELPLALAVLDQPADLPTGGQLAVGEMVKDRVTGLKELPVKWHLAGSEEEVQAMMDRQEVYGALVLPADFSAGVMSLGSPEPKPAAVKLYVNEGMSSQGVTAARTILQQMALTMKTELTGTVLTLAEQRVEQVPIGSVRALLQPFETEEVGVHPVGANNAGGTAPNLLTQIMWIGSMIMSVFFFLAARAAREEGGAWGVVGGQIFVGLVLTAGASGLLVWMAVSWYGMEMADPAAVWLFLWLSASAFFLMQTALFNWIGFPAIALLVMLLFFSLPILNVAPEFLPQATRDLLYSWTPFRYVADGLRSLMYYGGEFGMGLPYTVLWSIAGVGLAVVLASALRRGRARAEATAPVSAQSV